MSKYRRNNIKPTKQGGTSRCSKVIKVKTKVTIELPLSGDTAKPVQAKVTRTRTPRVGKRPKTMSALPWA